MKLVVAVLFLAVGCLAQEKPKLSLPQANLCANRLKHYNYQGHQYLFSWNTRDAGKRTWFHARNYCRDRCMDLVSMETGGENEALKRFVENGVGRGDAVWTSGRLCNFNEDCTAPHLQPINVNGWFWATPRVRMLPTDRRTPFSSNAAINDWSQAGRCGAQPDQCDKRADEACMTVGNNLFSDGIKWHDETCHLEKAFICEDSDELIKFTRFNNRNLNI